MMQYAEAEDLGVGSSRSVLAHTYEMVRYKMPIELRNYYSKLIGYSILVGS